MLRRWGLLVYCSSFARDCFGGFYGSISHKSSYPGISIPGSSGRVSTFGGVSRPGRSYPSVAPSRDFIYSVPDVDFSKAGITAPRHDDDGHSSAVGASLGCPSHAGSGLGHSSSNGDGGSPRIEVFL